MDNIKNNSDAQQEVFNESFKKLMKDIDLPFDSIGERSITPDKWDIIAGFILTGAISATIISVSAVSYYIIIGLINAGVLVQVGTIASAALKTKIINDSVTKMAKLFNGELKWLFKQNLFNLAASELKALHAQTKKFLIEHFENEKKIENIFSV